MTLQQKFKRAMRKVRRWSKREMRAGIKRNMAEQKAAKWARAMKEEGK